MAITTRAGKGSALTHNEMDTNFTDLDTLKAPLASPTLTGVPAAPTAAGGTDTTQIATTEFVTGEIATHNADVTVHGITAAAATVLDDATVGDMVATLGGAASTGTGGLVRADTPTLVTPVLGAATGTSIALGGGTALTTTNRTGIGNLVLATGPTISAPTLSGLVTTDGAAVTTANAMGAEAIDVTKGLNTKSISADTTFTFSATATARAWFSMLVANSDTAPHVLTVPSSYSMSRLATITTVVIPASSTMMLQWHYDGSVYRMFANDGYLSKYDGSAAPAVTDDVDQGYGPGSLWYDATGDDLYICEDNSNGAAVWTQVNGGVGDGDVSVSGTPSNNQVAIWTDSSTVEGDSALTFDAATDTLAIAASGKLAFGAVNILDDSAGTTTLSNIDALDATTEATIEAAIDTLANLTSIQGRTVTLADAGADALLGWDDSASAYQNLSASDARAAIVAATTSQTSGISFGIATVSDADYTIVLKAPHGGTITETATKCTSGTATATFKVNSTALGGTANAVSSSEQAQAHASTNTFVADDDIIVTMSSNSSCLGMVATIRYTRVLA